MKKVLSVLISVVFIIGCLPAAAAGEALPFRDVNEGDWFYPYVGYVYENGLMKGTSAKAFSPDETLDRAMFITIIGRLVGAENDKPSPFSDTEPDTWYSPYVAWAADLGIVKGFPDGTFRPYEAITREQMATATDRFLSAVGLNTIPTGGIFDFADEEKVSDWAVPSVGNLKKIGIFTGDNKGRFNPEANTTRAEAATVIMRLKNAIDSAWQGYVPADGDEALIYGAKYLFQNGSILSGGMKRGLDGDVLTLKMDAVSAFQTFLEPNTAGISVSCGGFRLEDYPIVKICYSFDGMEETLPGAFLNVNKTRVESAGFRDAVGLTPGPDEDGMRTATSDLSAIAQVRGIDYATQVVDLLFTPCAEDYDGDGSFLVRYVGFFKTRENADAFSADADPDTADYLENYSLGFEADIREYGDADREYYDKLLVDRIGEIKCSPSELTPEAIKERGGVCWYVSSIRGDDKNDGKSPETAFKTPGALIRRWYETNDGRAPIFKTKAGDGVFFERGSVFYPETYHNNSVSALDCQDGVDYGAYGAGDKPLFRCTLDFRDSGGVGNWEPTGYENVWKIDKIDGTVTEAFDVSAGGNVPVYWYGERSEIGNMFFDHGRAVGLRIVAKGSKQTLGDGIGSIEKGLYFNGLEYFYSEERSLENPGTALLHNLEFFHDYETGTLYLYWDKGNPADSFSDVEASRNGACAFVGKNTRVDNLAFVYSGRHCVEAGYENVTFTNCEIGCAGGNLGSAESGIEIFGYSDNVLIKNCFVHDVYDGALTSQGGGQIYDVKYIGNVMVACGNGAEIWNGIADVDENGVSGLKIRKCLVSGNLIAYNGYGPRIKQDVSAFDPGASICGSVGCELEDCRIENNVFLYGVGQVYYAYMATYRQPRGWESLGNVYVGDPSIYSICFSYETLNRINHGMWKRARISFPYTEEGLNWFTAQGVDPKGIYYFYTSDDPYKGLNKNGYFFMDGYYAERGENPSLTAKLG